MHASLAELLENLNPGLLWVTRDGVVRYANGEAAQRTGLAAGRKIYDPDLVPSLAAELQRVDLPPRELVLELTESELESLRDPRNWIRPVTALAAGGVATGALILVGFRRRSRFR